MEQLEHNTDKTSKIHEKKKRYLSEVIQTTKRLQSTVEHSNIIIKQVQAKFSASTENASSDKTADTSNAANTRRESDITQVGLIPTVPISAATLLVVFVREFLRLSGVGLLGIFVNAPHNVAVI